MSSPGLIETPFSASDLFNTQSMAGAVFAQNKAFDDLNQSQKFEGLTPAMFSDVQQFMANPSSMQDHLNTLGTGYNVGNHFIPLASQAAASVANAMGTVAGGVVGAGTPQLDTSGLNGAITNLTAAINKLSQSVGGNVTGAPSAVAGVQPAMTTGAVSSNTMTTSIGFPGAAVTSLLPSQNISPTFNVPTQITPANAQVLRQRFNNFPTLADPITQMGPPLDTASFIPYDHGESFATISELLPSAPPPTGPQFYYTPPTAGPQLTTPPLPPLPAPPPLPALIPSQQLREASGISSHAQPDPLNLSHGGNVRRPFPPSTSGHSIMGAFRSGLAGGMIHQDHTFMQRKAVHAGRYAVAATREFLNAETSTNLHSTISVMPGEGRMLGQGLRILDEQTSIQVPVNRALARASLGFDQTIHEQILNDMVESGFMDLPDAAEFIATTTSLSGDTNAVADLFFAHQINEDAEGQAGLMGMLNARGMDGRTLTNQAVRRARNNGIRGAAVTEAANVEIQAILEERTSGVGTRGRGGRRGIIAEAEARGGRDMQRNIASIKRGRSQILRARNLITDPFKGVGEALLFAHALEEKDGDLVEAHHFLSDMGVSEKTSLFRSIGGKGLSDMLRLQGGEESGDLGPAGAPMTEASQLLVPSDGLEVAKAVGKAQLRLRKATQTPDREAVNLVRIDKESDLSIHQLRRMDEKVEGGRGIGATRRDNITKEFGAQMESLIGEVQNLEKTMDEASKAIVDAADKFKFDIDPNATGPTAALKQISNVGMTILLQTIMNTAGMRNK